MTKGKESIIDRSVLEEVGAVRKIRLLMETREGSVGRWAINRGVFPEQVHQCLSAKRAYPEIRDAIAEWLGVDRSVIDEAIEATVAEPVG